MCVAMQCSLWNVVSRLGSSQSIVSCVLRCVQSVTSNTIIVRPRMTAAVASSTLLFYSIMDFSKEARLGPSFLLHASVGNDDTCYPQSGPQPGHAKPNNVALDDSVEDDDSNPHPGKPFRTCFSFNADGKLKSSFFNPTPTTGSLVQDQCWSRSYNDHFGNWQPCKPKGFGWEYGGWEYGHPINDNTGKTPTCGKPCTEFD